MGQIHLGEVSFFTAADKAFAIAFQTIPLGADVLGLVQCDGSVESGLGNLRKELRELGDDFICGGENFESLFAGAWRVAHEVSVRLFAEPLDDPGFFGQADDFEKPI